MQCKVAAPAPWAQKETLGWAWLSPSELCWFQWPLWAWMATHSAETHETLSPVTWRDFLSYSFWLHPQSLSIQEEPFSEQRCTYVLHGVIVEAVLTGHYVVGGAKLVFQTGRTKTKGVAQIRKPWMSEWHFCPSDELCLLKYVAFFPTWKWNSR